METDEQEIRELHSTWIAAVNEGDLARLLTLMTDDAVFLSPGRAPIGRDGFPSAFSAGHQEGGLHCISELDEVAVSGDIAYTRSRDTVSVSRSHLAGHRITVYRKQPDGRWLLARDTNTLASVGK